MSTSQPPSVRLGERLVAKGKLSERDLERALLAQQEMKGLIGEVMIRLGLVAEHDVTQALSEQLGVPYVAPKDLPDLPTVADYVRKTANRYTVLKPLVRLLDEFEDKAPQVGYTF